MSVSSKPGPLHFILEKNVDALTAQRIIDSVCRLGDVTDVRPSADRSHLVVSHVLDSLPNATARLDAKIDLHSDVETIIDQELQNMVAAVKLP